MPEKYIIHPYPDRNKTMDEWPNRILIVPKDTESIHFEVFDQEFLLSPVQFRDEDPYLVPVQLLVHLKESQLQEEFGRDESPNGVPVLCQLYQPPGGWKNALEDVGISWDFSYSIESRGTV